MMLRSRVSLFGRAGAACLGVVLISAGLGAGGARQASAPVQLSGNANYFGLAPQFAVSPDGRELVFVASLPDRPPMLWVRSLGANDPRLLALSEQASYPFWSADGKSIGFFAAGKLKTVSTAGGAVTTVCDAPTGRGGAWNAGNVIVYASGIGDPLRKVAAAGGTPSIVTTVDVPRENSHRWPQFLPDGRHILFWGGAGIGPAQLKVASLDSTDVVVIGPADTNGAYAARFLFYKTGNRLMAQGFDAATLSKLGAPVQVADPISADAGSAFASFSVSTTGTIVYTRGPARPFTLTWFDRSGKFLTSGTSGQYTNVSLNPDDSQLAVSLTDGAPPNRDIWALALSGLTATFRLTSDPAVDATPIWSADGKEIVYSSQRGGPYQMYRRPATGPAGQGDEQIFKENAANVATDWSRDGRFVAFTRTAPVTPSAPVTGLDIWVLPLFGDRTPQPLLQTPAGEDNAAFSPDGRWIAYQTNASGQDEVYVHPFAAEGGAIASPGMFRVSQSGGTQPRWRSDGRELFFLSQEGAVMGASISPAGTSLTIGTPARLLPALPTLVIRHSYSPTKDGQKFVLPVLDQTTPAVIIVIPRWGSD